MSTKKMVEQWVAVRGYEGSYQVSDLGRVRSVTRVLPRSDGRFHVRQGINLKPMVNHQGYFTVRLYAGSVWNDFKVHELVLTHFVSERPTDMEACHFDDDPTNNTVENLRWGTRSDNIMDQVRNGNHNQASKKKCAEGHEYTPENTYAAKRGERQCKICYGRARKLYQNRLRDGRLTSAEKLALRDMEN